MVESIASLAGPTSMLENLTRYSHHLLPEKHDPLYVVIPVTIIYLVIFITGVLGNILTCIIIAQNRTMHTATNYFLFSLAVSDLLLLISGLPPEIYSIWSKYPYVFGEAFCVIRGLAAETSANASVLTIVSFTIERYLAICHPFLSYTMSKLTRALRIIFVIWLIAIITALPQALQFGLVDMGGIVSCLQTKVIMANSFEISTFVFFFAPMLIITVFYILIAIQLKESKYVPRKEQTEKQGEKELISKKFGRSTRRVIKMLVAVVVAFFICWAPFHAQRLIAIYGTNEGNIAKSRTMLLLYGFMTYTSGILYYFSTTINPILYHTMSKKFQEAFKATLLRWQKTRCAEIIAFKTFQGNGKMEYSAPDSIITTNGKQVGRFNNHKPVKQDSERTLTSLTSVKQFSHNSLQRAASAC